MRRPGGLHQPDGPGHPATDPGPLLRSTTILSVRHRGQAAIAGDGQVSFGEVVMKHTARKVRRMYNDQVIAGFAGAAADAFALFTKFEAKLEEFNGNLPRAAVELAKKFVDWALSVRAQNLMQQWFRIPLNPKAEVAKGAVKADQVKLINFDAVKAGEDRDRLIKRWRSEIGQ